MKKLIYLASPYSHPDKDVVLKRVHEVENATARLLKAGYLIFSPIVHSHPLARTHGLDGDWKFWKKIDKFFIRKSDELWVLMLDGWKESEGVTAEIEVAAELKKPVHFIRYPALTKDFICRDRYREQLLVKYRFNHHLTNAENEGKRNRINFSLGGLE